MRILRVGVRLALVLLPIAARVQSASHGCRQSAAGCPQHSTALAQ